MKRDMDLARKILLAVEEWEGYPFPAQLVNQRLEAEGYSFEQVNYHVWLLENGGLLVAAEAGGDVFAPCYLTWAGHEFLEAVRDDTRWNTVKRAMAAVGGFVVEVGKQVAIAQIQKQLP